MLGHGRLSRRILLNAAGAVLVASLLLFAADRARKDFVSAYGLAAVNASSLARLQLQSQV